MPGTFLSSKYNAPEFVKMMVDVSQFDQRTVTLTDARLVGVMIRDGRLSLRNHAAITPLLVQATGNSDEILLRLANHQSENNYIKYGGKDAFYIDGSKDDAVKFRIVVTSLGFELFVGDDRVSIFDDFYDVSIGKPDVKRSSVPLIVRMDPVEAWANNIS